MDEWKSVYQGSGPQRLPDEEPVAVWHFSDKASPISTRWTGRMELYSNGALYQITDSHRAYEGSPFGLRLFRSPEDVEAYCRDTKAWRSRKLTRVSGMWATPAGKDRSPEAEAAINQQVYNRWLDEHDQQQEQARRWAIAIAIAVGVIITIIAIQGGGTGIDPGDCMPGLPPSQGGC